ncbi:MAG: DUF6452 family protein [Flavobacteriaceae bacterium]
MNKQKNGFLGLLALLILFGCERDDICIETVTESPDLILLMLDFENPQNRKTPSGFSIRPIGIEKSLPKTPSDSLALPLKIQENNIQFEFIINQGSENENIDTLQINYQRFDTFINTACGYRSNFILDTHPALILNPGFNWIKGVTVLKDTISDETRAHLGILH